MQSDVSGDALSTFDLYKTADEHEELRSVVRALADAKIAPYAAAVDEDARFPQEAYDALRAAELQAIHIPEAYGGTQADALAFRQAWWWCDWDKSKASRILIHVCNRDWKKHGNGVTETNQKQLQIQLFHNSNKHGNGVTETNQKQLQCFPK